MAATIKRIRPVGRYAVGIDWTDGHESILPHRHLRLACPCNACVAATPEVGPKECEAAFVRAIGAATLFIAWADEHETLFVADELRALCRCAYCVREPNYPISGQ
ncbi:MAG: hypothetical protein B6D46_08495 [Polyangiaceae bacterium UTPRO1]|jgi:DUF971 family protein|nr:gamma-butyrobetaine hydroxylase-like domain-containing protein [Myxococcales bacterium]OQY66984.1 MAG: hypothetical protein B6D46_08495 [Polyangiaceae bacterium UTPRO1]